MNKGKIRFSNIQTLRTLHTLCSYAITLTYRSTLVILVVLEVDVKSLLVLVEVIHTRVASN